ncbi:hypothetical protein DFJ58DRAFT_145428 [Suillus subalutaceus]|uniref:uncharacterized protein n=1 Tax=Suillus subalutaceus TaxID=48586 RepID=UPI001B86C53A|nr:uncharacterized protein DFJ58DRAFT_145428 [Suillus subalutaceus]KAG1837504.1 hypothetical protein DFJ58DRAFT_145428 [Suillus subalutaceus]
MTRRKGNSSRVSTQQTHTSSEGTARESSHRPRGRVGRFLQKVKGGVNSLRTSRSKNSRSHSPVPQNGRASSTSAAPSRVQVEADAQSAREAVEDMHSLPGHATTVVSLFQGAREDLDTADKFQDTYLEPFKVFDDVIGKIADVHPYAKMALGVLSSASESRQSGTRTFQEVR